MGFFDWLSGLFGSGTTRTKAQEEEHAKLMALLGPVGETPLATVVRKIAINQVDHRGVLKMAEHLVSEETTMGDLGCDTLDAVEIILAIEEYYEVKLPEVDEARLEQTTLGEVIQLARGTLSANEG